MFEQISIKKSLEFNKIIVNYSHGNNTNFLKNKDCITLLDLKCSFIHNMDTMKYECVSYQKIYVDLYLQKWVFWTIARRIKWALLNDVLFNIVTSNYYLRNLLILWKLCNMYNQNSVNYAFCTWNDRTQLMNRIEIITHYFTCVICTGFKHRKFLTVLLDPAFLQIHRRQWIRVRWRITTFNKNKT